MPDPGSGGEQAAQDLPRLKVFLYVENETESGCQVLPCLESWRHFLRDKQSQKAEHFESAYRADSHKEIIIGMRE